RQEAPDLRQHLPLRRAAHHPQTARRFSLLPVPLRGAASARPGPKLPGSRSIGRPGGHDRSAPGCRGDQGDRRIRHVARRLDADLRRARDELPQDPHPERPWVSPLRRAPPHHRPVRRLRSLVRDLSIPRHILDEMIAHARELAPHECCGMLAGKDGRATRHYKVKNVVATKEEGVKALFDEAKITTLEQMTSEARADIAFWMDTK